MIGREGPTGENPVACFIDFDRYSWQSVCLPYSALSLRRLRPMLNILLFKYSSAFSNHLKWNFSDSVLQCGRV